MLKKKLLCTVLASVLVFGTAAVLPQKARLFTKTAYAEKTTGWYYVSNKDGENTISLIGYYGSGTETELVIPNIYDGKTVTRYSNNVISNNTGINNCDAVEKLTISGNVWFAGNGSIGWDLSDYFPNLKEIEVSEDHKFYCTVDGVLYDKDKSMLLYYPNAKTDPSYIMPETVERMDNGAFYGPKTEANHPSLKSITLSQSFNNGSYITFSGIGACNALEEIKVDEANTEYTSVDGVLYNKDKTELVAYPNAKKDTLYTIPDGVSLNYYSFPECPYLKRIEIENDFSYHGMYGVAGYCKALEEFVVDEANTKYSSVDGILYNKEKTTLIRYPSAKSGTTFEVPESVTTIESDAFSNCNKLKSLTIPKSVTWVGYTVFSGCSNLTEIFFGGTEEDWNKMTYVPENVEIKFAAPESSESTESSKPAATTTATDIADLDEDGLDIGAGVTAILDEKAVEKFGEDFNIIAKDVYVKPGDTPDKDGNDLVYADANVVKDLSKALKKEIAKIKLSEFKIIDIGLADGDYVESTAPTAIKFTVNVPFDAKVYHVNGDSVEKLKSTSRKKTDGSYDVSFSTKNFSPFIFTTADLKNAKATNKDNDPVDTSDGSAAAADSSNPNTGVALAIAPVVLAAGAVAVVALKKKH